MSGQASSSLFYYLTENSSCLSGAGAAAGPPPYNSFECPHGVRPDLVLSSWGALARRSAALEAPGSLDQGDRE